MKKPSRKILFVCNGNVFRSFSAEVLLKSYLDKNKIKGWEVFSAGVVAKKEPVDPEVLADLKKLGVKDLHHTQHKLNAKILKTFDLVVAVAQDQIDFMKKHFNYNDAVLFNELVKDQEKSIWDIEDTVKDYVHNRGGVERQMDKTIQYIHDSIPRLVQEINNRVYLFTDFVSGRKKHANGFPFITLYETPNTIAFMSISIPTKEDGHILIIPKKRFVHFQEIPAKVLSELIESVQKIGAVIGWEHQGYNVLLNNGRVAGQYIFHAHFHILPRDAHDHIGMEQWTTKRITAKDFRDLNYKLKKEIAKVEMHK